jgi:hypothetical protein
MKWTVEVTHPLSGEEMLVRVEAATRDQAAACARDGGWLVRDCYRAGRGAYKVIRTLAWVWVGWFALVGVVLLLCGLGGWLSTPGSSGIGEALVGLLCTTVAALLGVLVAHGMTNALRGEARPDRRRGFDVLTRGQAPTAQATRHNNDPPPA